MNDAFWLESLPSVLGLAYLHYLQIRFTLRPFCACHPRILLLAFTMAHLTIHTRCAIWFAPQGMACGGPTEP